MVRSLPGGDDVVADQYRHLASPVFWPRLSSFPSSEVARTGLTLGIKLPD
jgi:hypothetical protein